MKKSFQFAVEENPTNVQLNTEERVFGFESRQKIVIKSFAPFLNFPDKWPHLRYM